MGIGSSFKKAVGRTPLAKVVQGDFDPTSVFSGRSVTDGGAAGAGSGATQGQVTAANVFSKLTAEQQKDILVNNPNIFGPTGSQTFDPLTNTIRLNESDFTQSQRERQEGLAAALTGSLSGNLPSSNEEIQDATFQRGKALLDPIFKQQRRDLEQQLADQGIPPGSERHNEALDRFEQSQGRQFVDLTQASIATAEQQRSSRFNEIASLLGTSQVQGIGFQQFQPQFSGLDLFGAEQSGLNRNAQNDMLSRQLKNQRSMAGFQALGSLGAAGIGAFAGSDERLKENIKEVGLSKNGIKIYEFEYKDKSFGEGKFKGVMAQEIKEIIPEAVIEGQDGFMRVNYDLIDVKFEKIN